MPPPTTTRPPALDDLRRRADTLRDLAVRAERLADEVDDLRRRTGHETWRGPTAERFSTRLGTQSRTLIDIADHLRAAARRLDATADCMFAG